MSQDAKPAIFSAIVTPIVPESGQDCRLAQLPAAPSDARHPGDLLRRSLQPAALPAAAALALLALLAPLTTLAGTAVSTATAAGPGAVAAGQPVRRVSPAELAALEVKDLSGTTVRPFQADSRKATVLIFVMHECPVANSFAPEITRILSDYAPKGVQGHVVYIEDDLSPSKARAHARDYGYTKGGLLDPGHRLVQTVGATVSPEAAVISKQGEVVYLGRIDDRVADFGKRRPHPTRQDLRLSLDALLAGQPIATPRTKAVGCYIPDPSPTKPQPKPKTGATSTPRG